MANQEVLDSHCFLSLFNQRLFDETVSRKKIIPEVGFNLSDGTYPEIDVHIKRRGWRRLASPQDEVAKAMRRPTEEELDLILRELCEDGATRKMGKGKDPKPIQLRRPELTNLARGWQEFVIHNLLPTGNKSEITVARAMLIHSIIRGDEIRAEEIIADQIILITQGLGGKGKIAFPSTIYKLCKAAKVKMNREYGGYEHIDQGRLITNEVMETIRIPQIALGQHVGQGNVDEPMPQFVPPHEPHNAAEGAEFGDQEHDQDHHFKHHWEQPQFVEPIPQLEQPPPQYNYQQQQPLYVSYADFQQFQQSQIEQMQSYQQSQTQLMQQYQQSQAEMMQQYQQKQLEAQQQGFQMLNDQVASMQIGIQNELGQYKEELNTLKGKQQESFVNTNNMCNRMLREQERMNRELIDLKKWQVSETVGRNEQSNKIMEAWNEQRGYMEGMSKQMKNWTRNASARECYDVWAHQQLNPNLVEMPVTKLVRLIYDNCDKKMPAFLGCLKSDHEAGTSSQAAPPATPTAAPTSAATATTTPAPAPAQQHDQDDYYPEQFFQK
ncbi:hypothetical protein PIB30_102226 [Stylosanthes scabra]|uniref:Putative plant transposon protein domain-containing protein n=1 Tax=Stylosanthes scabra TaxID=79078 RepID=A0ABU6TX94_9FABA|nr:hypothetical protein [Stylosanthes scabra]